jgi:hypothetical protein
VVYDGAGKRYLVVWSADPMLPGQVDDETDQFGRYVAVDGALQGTTDMRLSDMGPDGDTSYYVARPDLGFNPNAGELFAVWHGNDNTGTLVTDEREIFGQRLGASGA